MDGASADLAPVGQHGLVHVMAPHAAAAETGQDGRVDIHHPSDVAARDVQQAKPAGQANQLGFGDIDVAEDLLAEARGIGK